MDLRSDIYDASGFEVYYTAKFRPHDAAIFTVGQQILNIPPGQTSVVHHGVCSPRCSQLLLKGPIHVTSALNHMHYLGERKREIKSNEIKFYFSRACGIRIINELF